ncbi:MAG: hypothetical protein IPP66_04620 [Anaerolineales bacterium]|nr:hypothetical protein [Anaerolineales bacterium]
MNSCPTPRAADMWGFCTHPKHFSRLISFLAGRLRRPRPCVSNASRWAAV